MVHPSRTLLRAPLAGAALVLALASAARAATTEWIVDAAGSGDFTTIQAAVDAASANDRILVRPGVYPPFAIDGKALAVRAQSALTVRIDLGALVRNVPVGQQVELAGLRLNPLRGPNVSGLVCETSTGSVRVVDCEIGGHDGGGFSVETWYSLPALHARACAELALVRCTLRGGDGASRKDEDFGPPASDGSAALLAEDSSVVLLESALAGGRGGDELDTTCHDGGAGGAGLFHFGSGAFQASDASFAGGAGGRGGEGETFGCDCANGGAGGDGLRIQGTLLHRGSSFTGGAGGPRGGPSCSNGAPGQALFAAGGTSLTDRAPFCLGTSNVCPCANLGRSLAGCENSFATGGAHLELAGTARVSGDTLRLDASGLPTTTPPALFFQGTLRQAGGAGALFGDGLLCAGGEVLRLRAKSASGGLVSYGFGLDGDPLVSVRGAIPPAGGTRTYQVWYRNNQAFCSPSSFNLSNGVELTWAP